MRSPPSVKPPRPKKKRAGSFHHGDLAEQLARAANSVVEQEGHRALNMKKLATRLGVTEPAIYRHYASRDALLAEVAVRGFVDFIAHMRARGEAITDPFESIRAYGRAYVEFAVAHPGWFRLQFSRFGAEELGRFPALLARLGPGEAARIDLLERWRGALPPGDDRVADLYRLVWGTVHGLAGFVVERVFQLVKTDEERIAATNVAIDMMVDALRARASR
jgi:AcrR family transcriptional regulator